mmetsp:Transcript_1252/g.3668  ORF Transcript_1252/g.3668 Transcript_1252/m.3668 type:complete len:413 (-) Transcript_1252:214-1452(-)
MSMRHVAPAAAATASSATWTVAIVRRRGIRAKKRRREYTLTCGHNTAPICGVELLRDKRVREQHPRLGAKTWISLEAGLQKVVPVSGERRGDLGRCALRDMEEQSERVGEALPRWLPRRHLDHHAPHRPNVGLLPQLGVLCVLMPCDLRRSPKRRPSEHGATNATAAHTAAAYTAAAHTASSHTASANSTSAHTAATATSLCTAALGRRKPRAAARMARHGASLGAATRGHPRAPKELARAEISKFEHSVVRHQHVGTFDISMRNAVRVEKRKPTQDLSRVVANQRLLQRSEPLPNAGQTPARHVLHEDGKPTLPALRAQVPDQVGVRRQPTHHFDFALQLLQRSLACAARTVRESDFLHRHDLTSSSVQSLEDGPELTLADHPSAVPSQPPSGAPLRWRPLLAAPLVHTHS